MNERILELAKKKARSYVADAIKLGYPQDQVDAIRDEKFAELIIEDCIYAVGVAVHYRLPASSYIDVIREYFAVE